MRVIAGLARGVRLGAVPRGVRPVSDRAREGIFSSLGTEVEGARVLDLFAGTGAMGIEALSRGAEHVTFVERDRLAVAAVRSNLDRTRLAAGASVVAADVKRFLKKNGSSSDRFDLCFLDPPYRVPAVELARVFDLLPPRLAPGGWAVVLTRGIRSSMPVIPVDWRAARRLEYGDTLVIIYREV